MSKKTLDNFGPRVIPPGSCTWCGHTPHADACPSTIRTDTAPAAPCPCSNHIEGTRP